jgi:hypothetical protein
MVAIVAAMTWLLAVLVVSVVVGVARGGKLANAAEIHANGWVLLFVAFAIQIGALFLPDRARGLATSLILASYAALLAAVWLNRDHPGALLAGIGISMNFVVIALNGGMPVSVEAITLAGGAVDLPLDAKHVLLTADSSLPFMADVIPLPGEVISIGDVLLGVGIGVFIEFQMRRPRPLFRNASRTEPGSAAY